MTLEQLQAAFSAQLQAISVSAIVEPKLWFVRDDSANDTGEKVLLSVRPDQLGGLVNLLDGYEQIDNPINVIPMFVKVAK